jgi:hypothetical protein
VLVVDISDFKERIDKVGLALMSTVEAKEQSVKDEGIGEDLAINLFCWEDDRLALMLQARPQVQDSHPDERFDSVSRVACIVRRAWGITAFTMASEGYISTKPEETEGIGLRRAFAEGKNVKECLTVTHVENNRVTMVVRPYTYTVPRKVLWDDDIYYPGRTLVRDQDGMYANMFDRVLTTIEVDELPEDYDTFYDELSSGVLEAGFYIQQF